MYVSSDCLALQMYKETKNNVRKALLSLSLVDLFNIATISGLATVTSDLEDKTKEQLAESILVKLEN